MKLFKLLLKIMFWPFLLLIEIWSGPPYVGFIGSSDMFSLQETAQIKEKPYYKYISFLYHKKGESKFVHIVRLLFVEVPLFLLVVVVCLIWTYLILRIVLGNISFKTFLDSIVPN